MQIRRLPYSVVTVDIVTMDPDETFVFNTEGQTTPLLSLLVAGGLRSVVDEKRNASLSRSGWTAGQNAPWTDFKPGRFPITAGPWGATWICLSPPKDGPAPEWEHRALAGDMTIPVGWGFVVARGGMMLDGKAGDLGNYFRPRDADVEIFGVGDVVLVR